MHQLHRMLLDAADGRFPPVDGAVEVLSPSPDDDHVGDPDDHPGRRLQAVVEFTGHSVVLTDRPAEEVFARDVDGFGGASHPDVLRWLAGDGGWIGTHDAVLAARGTGGSTLAERHDLDEHPRVVRSRAHRRDVRVYGDDEGLVTIGRGLVGRLEVSVEVLGMRHRGTGARLIVEARGLVPAGDVVFAQVAPGNAASLRAFLSCGFAPVGAETLVRRAGEVASELPGRDIQLQRD